MGGYSGSGPGKRSWARNRRRRGRPKKRWLHDLEDLRVMKVGRWWEKVRSKEERRRIVREAKAHPGL
jgi:hypothetical protein